MNINEKNKKGELTTQQIVILIIIVVSFIVLIYFLFLLNPNETSAKEVCYNSIVLLSKSSDLIGHLDCKTTYVDIKDSEKEKILKKLSDEMVDCWWMFGHGEIDYASGLLASKTHCAICSEINFDSKIQESIKEISSAELYNYMATHSSNHDASKSYLNYLYGVNEAGNLNTISLISTSKEYAIITGIDPTFPYVFWHDKNMPVSLVDKNEIGSKTGCQVFDITRA